ncbi:hypothetical protein INR49_019560 [Caranx melampygus]|nr:hypothetical protein INR49_019560 [Caranx melampygus]
MFLGAPGEEHKCAVGLYPRQQIYLKQRQSLYIVTHPVCLKVLSPLASTAMTVSFEVAIMCPSAPTPTIPPPSLPAAILPYSFKPPLVS